MDLYRRSHDARKWDTTAFALRLRKYTTDLPSTLSSMRLCAGVSETDTSKCIAALPLDGTPQRSYARIVHELYAPHDWANFLARRFHLTFGTTVQPAEFENVLKHCVKLRPLLVFSFLRWTLNSLPTASRLHDDGHSSCPFCGSLDAKTSHLAECNVGISAVTSFMYCGQVQTTNVFVPFLSSFVMRRSGLDCHCFFLYKRDRPSSPVAF